MRQNVLLARASPGSMFVYLYDRHVSRGAITGTAGRATRGGRPGSRNESVFLGVISTPLNNANFNANITVPLSAQATTIVGKEAVVANLECATVQDAVIYSLTFDERITYVRAADGATVTEAFSLPYANSLSVPGTVAGMNCEIAAILSGLNVTLTAPGTVTNNISFTITVSTYFPPPEAQDFDSNQISLLLA